MIDLKKVSLVVLSVLVVGLLAYLRLQTIELQKTELIYNHPRTETKISERKVVGPVRIVTRIVEKKGEKVTEIVEDHATTVETRGEEKNSTPVFALNSNRWLLGAGLLNFSPHDSSNWTAYAGYGFHNRLDVLYGVSYHDRFNQSVLLLLRF